MRFPQFIAATCLAFVCAIAPTHAEQRVALVIGNNRYANLSAGDQLQKAVNDARSVGGALRRIGFDVITGEDLSRGALVDRLDELTQRLSPGDTAFFFFSGHGVALDGVNYILPTDVPNIAPGQETRMKLAALAETDIVAGLAGRGVRVAVVVLDACRTNPFRRAGAKSVGGEKGLAPPPPVQGVFSLYAAGSGQAARDRLSDDDRNPNSVFTRVLVPALTRPGVDLTALAFDVREEVSRIANQAGYDQRPAYYDETVGGRVYLAGLPRGDTGGERGTSPAPAGPAADEAAWNIVKDTTDPLQLHRFIAQFPTSPRRREAEERIEGIKALPVPSYTKDWLGYDARQVAAAPAVPPTGMPPSANPSIPGLGDSALTSQQAILYDEDPANPNGTRFVGNVTWRTERIASAIGQKPEVEIHGDIEIPEQKVSARLSLRRNNDKQLPASHVVDIQFKLPPEFPHGGVANLSGIMVTEGETNVGIALNGVAVKVMDNSFLMGLSSAQVEMQRNIQLLKDRSWFDIPIVYGDGKRALIAVEKGPPGERAFTEAFAAWEQAAVVATPVTPASPLDAAPWCWLLTVLFPSRCAAPAAN